MKRILFILAILAAPALAGENLVPKLAQHWKTSKAYTLLIAQQMPEEDFGFKPNPDQMTFKEQMLHIAGMNEYFLGKVTGRKASLVKPVKLDKASVIQAVNESFDYVIAAVSKLTPGQADRHIETLLQALDHTTHHRGQCVVYLRARNIKPAEYQY